MERNSNTQCSSPRHIFYPKPTFAPAPLQKLACAAGLKSGIPWSGRPHLLPVWEARKPISAPRTTYYAGLSSWFNRDLHAGKLQITPAEFFKMSEIEAEKMRAEYDAKEVGKLKVLLEIEEAKRMWVAAWMKATKQARKELIKSPGNPMVRGIPYQNSLSDLECHAGRAIGHGNPRARQFEGVPINYRWVDQKTRRRIICRKVQKCNFTHLLVLMNYKVKLRLPVNTYLSGKIKNRSSPLALVAAGGNSISQAQAVSGNETITNSRGFENRTESVVPRLQYQEHTNEPEHIGMLSGLELCTKAHADSAALITTQLSSFTATPAPHTVSPTTSKRLGNPLNTRKPATPASRGRKAEKKSVGHQKLASLVIGFPERFAKPLRRAVSIIRSKVIGPKKPKRARDIEYEDAVVHFSGPVRVIDRTCGSRKGDTLMYDLS